jgi:ADP-ribose pyrophosphatase
MAEAAAELCERVIVFQGHYRVVRYRVRIPRFDHLGRIEMAREVWERGHAVAVLPYDPARDAVVLIEQFRIGPYAEGDDPWLLEIVAGLIEEGEAIEAVAEREAMEEAGLALQALVPITRFYVSPGASTETIMVYAGRVDSGAAGGLFGLAEEGEDIKVHAVPWATAQAWLEAGRIRVAAPLIALQWLALHRVELRRRWAG